MLRPRGERGTLTDANLVLGFLDPTTFAGGQIRLDRDAAERATRAQVAEPLGLDLAAAADGVHRIANANMERALRSMSIERGRDPRDYALVAFGGAGPLHACELARALGIPRVIVPRGAGVASAIGLLEAERSLTVSRTRAVRLDANGAAGELAGLYAALETRIRELFGESAPPAAWRRHAHLRYVGQGFELRIALPPGAVDDALLERIRDAFDTRYEAEYGYAQRDQPVEGTDWLLTGGPAEGTVARTAPDPDRGTGPPGGFEPAGAATRCKATGRGAHSDSGAGDRRGAAASEAGGSAHASAASPNGSGHVAPARRVSVRLPEAPDREGWRDCPVHDRDALRTGDRIEGPAIVAERESTLLLPAGDTAWVSRCGNLLIDVSAPGRHGGERTQ